MKSGRFVECGTTAEVITDPQHPCTRLLLDAVPRPVTKR
jgi:peptide/nickel transport system ATP-binding protein